MKKLPIISFISMLLILFSGLFSSCNDENFSSNPSHKLSFSQDTLSFDTVFTTIGSATAILKVYNHNKEALNISSIHLANAANSGFKINLDGEKGTQFSNVEIKAGDSLHVFVEVKVNPLNKDNPILIKDSLVFLTNGNKQDVKFLAYGQDVIILKGKTLKKDTIFTSKRPILVYDSIRVNKGVKLTCEAGTRLYFHDKASLLVHGTLIAEGALANPVLFRGDRLDRLFDYLPYDRIPGQWKGIRLFRSSINNSLNYADIHSGEFALLCDSSGIKDEKVRITNSLLYNVKNDVLSFKSCKAFIANSQLSNAGGNCINLLGGEYTFIHNTITNFYSWDTRLGVSLAFANYQDKIAYPLKASFYNCLISGSSLDELAGKKSPNSAIPFDYKFANSLINSPKEDASAQLINIIWASEKNFVYIGKRDLRYDFRPTSKNKAINIGDIEIAKQYPYDINGRERLLDGKPDAGCYEWLSTDKDPKL